MIWLNRWIQVHKSAWSNRTCIKIVSKNFLYLDIVVAHQIKFSALLADQRNDQGQGRVDIMIYAGADPKQTLI